MSYHIYTTKALVLRTRSVREADRVYALFTEDLGLIYSTAQAVRKEASKLRASLEPLSFSSISLVKGENKWRITSAVLRDNLTQSLRERKEFLKAFSRAASLLERLLGAEEKHPEIYALFEEAHKEAMTGEDAEAFELVLVHQTLFHLGYISSAAEKNNFSKKKILKEINEGLEASSLI